MVGGEAIVGGGDGWAAVRVVVEGETRCVTSCGTAAGNGRVVGGEAIVGGGDGRASACVAEGRTRCVTSGGTTAETGEAGDRATSTPIALPSRSGIMDFHHPSLPPRMLS